MITNSTMTPIARYWICVREAVQQQQHLADGDDESADQTADRRAFTARNRGATDQHGADRAVIVAKAELEIAARIARRHQDAGERRAQTRGDIGAEHDARGLKPAANAARQLLPTM